MQWDVDTLRLGLRDTVPIFFILTNTRALSPQEAQHVTQEVCHNLKRALTAEGIEDFLVVSRSDSTLRGHYPLETDVIAQELGGFDAHFLIPAFFEGGRFTKDSIHYLMVDGQPTPVHETEFAQDSVFGYRHSYLPAYVAEKTQNQIPAEQVTRFLLTDIRQGTQAQLRQLTNNQCVVVDAERQADLDCFAQDLLTVAREGKRFLFRSAASILTSLANLGPQPIAAANMAQYRPNHNTGAVIVGSHVQKSSEQLAELLKCPDVVGIEINVEYLRDDCVQDQTAWNSLRRDCLIKAQDNPGQTPVFYTSRQELTFPDIDSRLAFGKEVSRFLMEIVHHLPRDISFLISKGGITSNDVLSTGLALRSARLLGQILPGCSLVRTAADHPRFPNLPVVLFPGNVGDAQGLVTVYQRLIPPATQPSCHR